MSLSQQEVFQSTLSFFKDRFYQKSQTTRGQKLLPKLLYTFTGKYVYVGNHLVLCTSCNRSVKVLGSFMAKKMGVSYDITNKTFRFKGKIDKTLLMNVQKKFYEEEVLCNSCGSPETTREDSTVRCLSCLKVHSKPI